MQKINPKSGLSLYLDEANSLLTIEIINSLSAKDFELLSETVDSWIKKNNQLKGVIIHAKKFPYWENIDAFFSHVSFVKNHYKDVKKLALVADGFLPNLLPKIASNFVEAEIKNFHFDEFKEAKEWILS